jgi:hypothetical protein
VCATFISTDEARALRLVFAAHKAWSQYIYGSAPAAAAARGGRSSLDSVLQRIDFGPAGCFPEGVAATQSPMWPLDGVRARLLAMMAARVQSTFGELLPWATAGKACGADMMQLTQMRPREELAPHVDSRDRWGEGIASIAWGQVRAPRRPPCASLCVRWRRATRSEVPTLAICAPHLVRSCPVLPAPPATASRRRSRAIHSDFRPLRPSSSCARALASAAQSAGPDSPLGEPWTLCMRRGKGRAAEDSVDIALPGGACYIITRVAQGRTEHCAAGKLAHQWCTCCWRHGVQTNPQGLVTRQSVTIRCYAQRAASTVM